MVQMSIRIEMEIVLFVHLQPSGFNKTLTVLHVQLIITMMYFKKNVFVAHKDLLSVQHY